MTCPHGWRDEIDCETCRPRSTASRRLTDAHQTLSRYVDEASMRYMDSLKTETRDAIGDRVALALCNAERKHNQLPEIYSLDDLTNSAQEHYGRLATAALDVIRKWQRNRHAVHLHKALDGAGDLSKKIRRLLFKLRNHACVTRDAAHKQAHVIRHTRIV